MKLVQEAYGNERKFIVSDDMVKRGFDCSSNNDVLTDADETVFKEFCKLHEDDMLTSSYKEHLEDKKINNQYLPEKYIEFEEMEKLTKEYKYFYDDANCEYMESKYILDFPQYNFLEYWSGNDWEQIELCDDIIDLTLIEKNIEEKENHSMFGQYNLYKDVEDNLYVNWESYYQGNLGSVEEITEDELKDRFNYTIKEGSQIGFEDCK
jgi:hypothetical protein